MNAETINRHRSVYAAAVSLLRRIQPEYADVVARYKAAVRAEKNAARNIRRSESAVERKARLREMAEGEQERAAERSRIVAAAKAEVRDYIAKAFAGRKPTNKQYRSDRDRLSIERRLKSIAVVAKRDGYKECTTSVEEILLLQIDRCEICGCTEEENGRSLALDHCHSTGRFRGWLCQVCNHGIGHFRDSPELLNRAIRYLSA